MYVVYNILLFVIQFTFFSATLYGLQYDNLIVKEEYTTQ